MSSTSSSIRLRWYPIPENETGTQLQGYKVRYWLKNVGESNSLTIIVGNPTPTDGYIYYTLTGLIKDGQYSIHVFGYNRYNKDVKDNKEAEFTAYVKYFCKFFIKKM